MRRILIDESFNQRILRGLNRRQLKLDHVVAQRSGLKGAIDSVILAWASDHDRIVVTHDLSTLPMEAYKRVSADEPMPGLIAVPHEMPIGKAI